MPTRNQPSALRNVVDIGAVCLLGIMAGFFFAFAADVAPAMALLDASTYIETQQSINKVVRSPVFAIAYFGSTILPFVAAILAFRAGDKSHAWLWLALSVVYFVAVFYVTRTVNVPINDALANWQASAPPASWQQARDSWNQSNMLRTVAAIVCFIGATTLLSMRSSAVARK